MTINLAGPPRPDGYRPIANSMWRFARLGSSPSQVEAMYVLSAARRLDTSHAQFEHVREQLASINQHVGSIAWWDRVWTLLGDAEVAMISLHRALDMAAHLRKRLDIDIELPGFVASKRRDVREIRDAYEHIDARVFGQALRRGELVHDSKALEAFEFGPLLVERRFRYGRWSLRIDDEATRLMVETRDYLLKVWGDLNVRGGASPAAHHRPWWLGILRR
jgi:hypothetical protein